MIRHETQVRVRYPDTDKMAVVYHGVYLEYFEIGRTEMLRDLGMANSQIEANGLLLPVLETHTRMLRPAKYDDMLTVVSYLHELPSARMRIDYEIFLEDALITTGYTTHAFTTADAMRPVRPPREFLELVESAMAARQEFSEA